MDLDAHEEANIGLPVGLKGTSIRELRRALVSAVEDLSAHGLKLAAKWAAEQLVGLPDEIMEEQQHREQQDEEGGEEGYGDGRLGRRRGGAPAPSKYGQEAWLQGRIAFAKTLMDVGEFERASQVFGDRPSIPSPGDRDGGLPPRARFLRWYCLYLCGERKREEETQLTDALQRRRLVNPHLPALHAELSSLDREGSLDAFGLYIYGAVLRAMRAEGRARSPPTESILPTPKPTRTPRGGSRGSAATRSMDHRVTRNGSSSVVPGVAGTRARRSASGAGGTGRSTRAGGVPPASSAGVSGGHQAGGSTGAGESGGGAAASTIVTTAEDVLLRSVRLYPYNWSAWLDLASLCLESDTVPEGLENDPPCPAMYQFFVQHLLVEQHRSREALTVLGDLQLTFPNSSYVLSQTAVAHYHLRDFEQGHADFKELRRRDPLRIEGLDVFSNILYVKECKAELSYLAHMTVKSSPLRPETNCVIGNYYSLKGQHEKAVMYFLRALKLDRRCLSAWTLMGHEFVELKNAGAAIESYRQAVDINCKDYRPWYGLGQAYEILQMHLYAIYYYRRATALRPYDARMWVAMGKCLEELGKRSEAISTYERAMANDDREGISLNRLAELYTHEGKRDSAAKCYEMMLQRKDRDNASAEKGMNFLCRYYRDVRDFDNALRMAHALLDFTASREDALAMLREIRSISEAEKKPAMHMSPPRHREQQNVTPRGSDHRYGASSSGVSPGARGVAAAGNGPVDRGMSRPGIGPATRARGRESNYRKAEEAADVAPYNLSLGESPSILSRSSVDMSVAMSIASDSAEEGAEGAEDSRPRRGGRPGRVTPRRADAELNESGAGVGDVDSSAELLSP